MGTKKIDALQTAQITALETDVGQLRTKLNLVVDDALAISSKLNTLIGDLNDMNKVVMEGYTTPGSPESYGIQEAIDKYKDLWKDHKETVEVWYEFRPELSPLPNGTGNYNSASSGTLTGASWTSGSQAVAFTGTTGTISLGQRVTNTGVGLPVEGIGGAMIVLNTTSPLYLSDKFYESGSGTLSFVALAGTIHYGTYWDSYWDDWGPWGQDWFVHPKMRKGGHTSTNSYSAGAASYDNPVLGGTDQGTNSAHSADAANANVTGLYDNRERLLSIEPAAANRAKKLVRKTLNKLRSK